jgi:hypothetical protein
VLGLEIEQQHLNTQGYKWLVARGTITVVKDAERVSIEADPEGSAYCVMTAQDASEIAGIITEQARSLWEASQKVTEPKAITEGDVRSNRLTTDSGVWSLVAHESKPLIALTYDGQGACMLTVTQSVALVQLIEHMLENLSTE